MDVLNKIDKEMDTETLETTLKLIHQYTGITMQEYKKSMIQTRLRTRMRELHLFDYENYIKYLQSNENEIQVFVNLITTNETFFFRTDRVWEFFRKEFLENWSNLNSNKPLRIWSAASSSGEEAYSIAICCEEFKEKKSSFQYQIFGTDISTKAISNAVEGIYRERSIDFLKKKFPLFLNKYFSFENNYYRVEKKIKNHVTFKNHNIFEPISLNEKFDIVFLRNVLIYFSQIDQEIVLSVIENHIINGGILVLGESESIRNIKQNFHYKSLLIYEKNLEKI
jgi:chemotaxis protein methyltransferase CheR